MTSIPIMQEVMMEKNCRNRDIGDRDRWIPSERIRRKDKKPLAKRMGLACSTSFLPFVVDRLLEVHAEHVDEREGGGEVRDESADVARIGKNASLHRLGA